MTDREEAGAPRRRPSRGFNKLQEPIPTSPEAIFTQAILVCVCVYAGVRRCVEVPSGPGAMPKASGLLDAEVCQLSRCVQVQPAQRQTQSKEINE